MYKFIHPVPVDYMQSFPYNFGSGNKCSRVGIFFSASAILQMETRKKERARGRGKRYNLKGVPFVEYNTVILIDRVS